MAFHNHAAAMLTSLYKLGGNECDIRAVLDTHSEFRGLKQTSSQKAPEVIITRENWETHLGGHGLFGLGVHLTFTSYYHFFLSEIGRQGPDAVLRSYFPRLAKGSVGDFFHALIELGYYFESRNTDVLVVALAWIAASYVTIPEQSASERSLVPTDTGITPLEALETLSLDTYQFPVFELDDGSSGYISAMETLVHDHAPAVFKYDLATANSDGLFSREICDAAIASFAAGGHTDFYLLHLVTGTRATWAILNGFDWGADRDQVENDLLGVMWRSMLFTHVARNRPWLPPHQHRVPHSHLRPHRPPRTTVTCSCHHAGCTHGKTLLLLDVHVGTATLPK